MSRQNKVNPDHYKLGGRLAPDDLARERRRQMDSQPGPLRGRHRKPMPPWANASPAAPKAADSAVRGAASTAPRDLEPNVTASDDAAQQPQAKPRRVASRKVSGQRAQKKTARRKMEAGKQRVAKPRAAAQGARRGARKTSGARPKPKVRKTAVKKAKRR